MGMLLHYFSPPLVQWLEAGVWTRAGWLTVTVLGGFAVYGATLLAAGLRPDELRMKSSGASL
jgi:peptidoglycan biosynthesis protein MviN/MurJ (putative lipid II flippase)